MSLVFDLKQRLTQMGLSPKKAFGQNFLVNQRVIDQIISEVQSKKPIKIVEVGPGLGALTEPLLAAGLNPEVIEFDPELSRYWEQRGLPVHHQDALQLDWNQLKLPQPSLLVSNLPYQISTHIVIDRCLGPTPIQWMVLMFQKEVAERLTAKPRTKAYGTLSVMAQLHFTIKKVADCAPRDFYPAPKVASRVLSFTRKEESTLGVPFLKFVKHSFLHRRKFLLKNLRGIVDKSKVDGLSKVFADLGLLETARPEELSPEQFYQLYLKLYEH